MSGITFIRRDQNDGVNIVRMIAENTLAQVGTSGYVLAQDANIVALNHGAFDWLDTDMVLVSASDGWGFFTIASGFESLTPFAIVTGVTTPTIIGHIAVYDSTGGNIGEDAATAINGGNIQAGLSGTAGTLASFPATASKGSLKLVAVANTGNTVTTISNAAMGQASVISIPDPGLATSNFLLTDSAGTQSIATGNLSLTLGNLTVAVGTISAPQGNISAGSSGHAATVTSFPGTAANGSLILKAINAGGAFNTTISNSAMGQSSIISIPDPGAATSNFVLSQSAIPSNNVTFTKVITATAAALATAGKVNVVVHPSATSQFAVIDIKVLKSTGLSGGGGDRLLSLSDGTIVFNNAGVTAALLGTPILTLWGGSGNPIAVGASEVSTAGADIYLQYSGGATDYTTGSVQLAVTCVQVTA